MYPPKVDRALLKYKGGGSCIIIWEDGERDQRKIGSPCVEVRVRGFQVLNKLKTEI